MEKGGLRRSAEHFKLKGVEINSSATDRHVQINKWIRENMGRTKHYYDVWHIAS